MNIHIDTVSQEHFQHCYFDIKAISNNLKSLSLNNVKKGVLRKRIHNMMIYAHMILYNHHNVLKS